MKINDSMSKHTFGKKQEKNPRNGELGMITHGTGIGLEKEIDGYGKMQ